METDIRIIIMGPRWSGKSSTANTILGRFESDQAGTLQCDVQSGVTCGHRLTIVDVPGWSHITIKETSVANKQNFKLSWTKCLPGPHVFLLVIPMDKAFTQDQGQYVQEYLSLLGDHVWRHVVVIFTSWDYLDKKTTIDDHIESKGEALQKVLQKCENRFQVFDNKNNTNPDQVQELLRKIEELVKMNAGGFYKGDEKILQAITEKRKLAAERASQRKMETDRIREKQRQILRELEQKEPITKLRVVLLGSQSVGKSATLNTILGGKIHESGKMTTSSVMHEGHVDQTLIKVVDTPERHVDQTLIKVVDTPEGHVDQTLIKVVDTPGWLKNLNVKDTTEHVKQEIMRSVFLCSPGPHVFLLVIDTEASFTEQQHDALESHLRLLGENVWRHVILVFSKGDWLRELSIEEYIEVEGDSLTALVNKCRNRYHVLRNKGMDARAQVTELLQRMKELVAENQQDFFRSDENVFKIIEEKRRLVKQRSRERTEEIKAKKQKVTWEHLSEIRVVLLGQKKVGKSAAGNSVLCQDLLHILCNTESQQATADVAGRKVLVVDTPGWSTNHVENTLDHNKELIQGLTLCCPGPHAFLLVLPTHMPFTDQQHRALEDHMVLFGEDVWKFTLVLFTYGDQLGDQTIEEHIMMEHPALQKMVERCGNRYHVLDNKSKSESNQVPDLLKKIEEMVAINEGKHYIPNMTEINQRVEEKFAEREISVCLEEKWKKREAEIYEEFKDYLLNLMMDLRGQEGSGPEISDTSHQPKPAKQDAWWKPKVVVSLIKQSKRAEKVEKKICEKVEKKICEKIKSIETDLKNPNSPDSKMRSSFDYIGPSMSDRTLTEPSLRPRPKDKFQEVLAWMSTMKIEQEDPLTFNYSQATSGYQSNISDVFSRAQIEEFKNYLSRLLMDLEKAEVSGLDTSDKNLPPEPAKQDLWRKVRNEKIEEMKKNISEKIDSLETELQNVSDSN
ncbi:uncharacterized protein LOC143109575 [Alosa pseudoharengus]|uniref:uncharacterized protein LOC143109575 n=1 Tax=Alosa pseudoharengus TaxID=34774 RepID=UPI003F899955